MKKPLLIAGILALLGVGGWVVARHQHNASPGEHALFGNVDIREVSLGFRVAGRLTEVMRDEGDEAKPGDILARLDDGPFRREVEEAVGRVESARARLALLEAGSRPQEIAQAQAVLRERTVTYANAERLFKRMEELFQGKTISQQERDDAEARFREAEARLNSAREQVSLLEAGFRQEEVTQARAELVRAEATLASAKLRLEDTVLKAPSEGVVLTRAQEPGAILAVGSAVLTLSLKRPVWVRAYVSEPALGAFPPGRKVRLFTDSRRDKPYAGQVGFVSPRAEFTPKTVETPELRTSLVYRLRIVVEDPDDALRQGMPVTVRLAP